MSSHPQHSHYGHRTIVTQPVAGGAAQAQTRLAELLEFVKQEFDNVHTESQQAKSWTQDLETSMNMHVGELGQLRDKFLSLEREHTKIKAQYEDEIRRLHHELDRAAANGAPPHLMTVLVLHLTLPPFPNLKTLLLPRRRTGFLEPIWWDHEPRRRSWSGKRSPGGMDRDRERDRERERAELSASHGSMRDGPYGNGAVGPRGAGGNHEQVMAEPPGGGNKRPRPDRDEDMRAHPNLREMHGGAVSPGPMVQGGTARRVLKLIPTFPEHTASPSSFYFSPPIRLQFPSLPGSSFPCLILAASTSAAFGPFCFAPGPISGGPQPLSGTPAPTPNLIGNSNVLLDLDPETLPGDMKKEGSDWMTMFNPKVNKVLDVGLVHTLVHDSVVCCVKFSPDGKTLATGCNRNTTLYDTRTGAKICSLVDESSGTKSDNYIRSASFSPDGKYLSTGSEDKTVRIWDLSKRRILYAFRGHTSEIYSLAFSPDGRMLVSGSGDKTARIWDMENGKCLINLLIEDKIQHDNTNGTGTMDAGVTSVAVSPDGTLIAAGSLDTMVRLWDAHTGELLDRLKGHKDSVYSVAFSPDGTFLVSGSLDKTLKMWDLGTLDRESGAGANVPKLENGKNGEKVTTDKHWDATRSSTLCTTTLSGHKDYVLSVAVSPDGAWIVSGSKDRGVQFWDPKTTMAQFMLQGHKNSVISIAVSDVGGLLATGSGDWNARIWAVTNVEP